MKAQIAIIAGLVPALAGPAMGAEPIGRFALPAGCEAYVTVQKRNCVVSHLFTCAADPEGWQRRADLDETGLIYLGVIDAETQWIESQHLLAGTVDRLGDAPADPASFSELLETGRDSFEFETVSEPFSVTRYSGHDRLTGKSVTIDGVSLRETEFEVVATAANGAELYRISGREYVQPEWRSFLSGQRQVTTPDESYSTDATPHSFEFPDDPGFLAAKPHIGCEAVMSSLSGDLVPTAPGVIR